MHTTYAAETRSDNRCALCCQIAGDPTGDVIHQLLDDKAYKRRVVDLSAGLSLVPSLGSLADLHILLCPKQHSRRIIDAIEPNDLQQALNVIKQFLSAGDGSGLVLFEHGASRNGPELPCSVEHAHLHVVDLPRTNYMILPPVQWIEVSAGITAAREVLDHREYLLWSDDQLGTLVAQREDGERFPSQVLRKAVANALGPGTRWNWRDYPDAISADAMYGRIASAFVSDAYQAVGNSV